MNESTNPFSGRLVFGALLLSLGVLWTADNLGLTDAGQVLRWWPLLLLGFGVSRIVGWGCARNVLIGVLASVLATLMLLHEVGWVHAGLGLIWPLVLVALGVQILMRGARASGPADVDGLADGSDYLHSFALMGASSTRSTSQALRGGELTAIMGGVELDLREARPADGRVVVDVFAFMGGIDIAVPANWRVEFNATPVMGGLQDSRGLAGTVEATGTLVVRGMVVLGGLEVSNEPSGRKVVVGVSRRGRRERYARPEVRVGNGGVHVRTEGPRGVREVRIDSSGVSVGPPPPPPPPPPAGPPPTEPR
jgi:hypothetical protein